MLHADAAPTTRGAPAGLPGTGPVRLVPAGEHFWLVAADAPLPAYDAPAIEAGLRDLEWVSARALAHEAVVEHFMARGTVVPMKLFTLFANDERATEHVSRRRTSIRRVVARIEGCEEWGVRLGFDPSRARREQAVQVRESATKAASGTNFLQLKSQAQRAARDASAVAHKNADDLFAALGKRARASRRRPTADGPGANVVLDAAFLVESPRIGTFRQAVEAARAQLATAGLEIVLTGPWPPYNFIAEEA